MIYLDFLPVFCYTTLMDDLTQHPKYAEVMKMKIAAEADEHYTLYCFDTDGGRHKVFFVEADQALVPGHIYSRAGYKEYGISGLDEFCFDRIFPDDDEDDTPYENTILGSSVLEDYVNPFEGF